MAKPTTIPLTVLLVDDDPDCRLLVRDAIGECDEPIEVREVASGDEALRYLRREGDYAREPLPSLIYLDIEMPGTDGLETLRRIREDPRLRDVPVVMMTGVSDESQMRRAAGYGANSYTLKPVAAEEFLRTVLTSTNYWLTVHQYPRHRLSQERCRR
jgi:two-component system response regulator